MRHRPFAVLSAVSIFLFLVVAFNLPSGLLSFSIDLRRSNDGLLLGVFRDGLYVHWIDSEPAVPVPTRSSLGLVIVGEEGRQFEDGVRRDRSLWIPATTILVVFAILPSWWARSWHRSRRLSRNGLCPSCGYDLRATPERCPECGHVSSLKAVEVRA